MHTAFRRKQLSISWRMHPAVLIVRRCTISTFDSGATPKQGERRIVPKKAADVDLEAVRRQMAETIERAKQDDPKALRKRIAELEKRIANPPAPKAEAKMLKASAALTAKDRKALEAVATKLDALGRQVAKDVLDHVAKLNERLETFDTMLAKGSTIASELRSALNPSPPPSTGARSAPMIIGMKPTPPGVKVYRSQEEAHRAHPSLVPPPGPVLAARVEAGPGDASVGNGGLRRILIALAQRPQGLNNSQLGVRAQLAQSGSFRNYLSKARTQGWISEQGPTKFITQAGLSALGGYTELPSGSQLLEHWQRELGGGAARLLSAFADAYPRALANDDVAKAAGLEISGSFRNYMSKLRTLQLIERMDGGHVASEELFS